jgi:hypothetical protein
MKRRDMDLAVRFAARRFEDVLYDRGYDRVELKEDSSEGYLTIEVVPSHSKLEAPDCGVYVSWEDVSEPPCYYPEGRDNCSRWFFQWFHDLEEAVKYLIDKVEDEGSWSEPPSYYDNWDE